MTEEKKPTFRLKTMEGLYIVDMASEIRTILHCLPEFGGTYDFEEAEKAKHLMEMHGRGCVIEEILEENFGN